jgi:methyl-accepting chemotaxis protein
MGGVFAPAFAVFRRSGPIGIVAIAVLLAAPPLFAVGAFALQGDRVLVILAAVSTSLGLYGLAALHRWITSDASLVRELVERIASGDLTGRAADAREDVAVEGPLGRSVAQMSRNLREIVHQAGSSADVIVRLAREMASGSTALSKRTQDQTTTLEQTAAGMQEIAANVRQNAESCRRASAVAATASGVAGRAAERMRDVTRTMEQIAESSRQVADIVGTIEGIAFQTNILALNAAVEAARAGEQGRGFAVVATEVRDLAQRSAAAAQEVKALIDASAKRVTEGTLLVEEAGGTMTEVVTSVRQVTDLIAEVAAASSEQIAGVEEIDKAINRMEGATQQNAALVERTASAATAFEEEAGRLAAVVGTFKVDRGEDRDRAVHLVKQAVAHAREKGLRRACDDFNDPRGRFCRGNHYIWAGDFGGVILANGTAPDARGQNNFHLKAADGRLFIQEIIETARTKGKGWCDYPWKNPVTKRTEQKSTYFEAVDGAFIACGIYKGKRADVAATPVVREPAPPLRTAL